MNRVNLLLLVALVASSLYLVHLAYESRRLFTQVDRARAENKRLERDHDRLVAERQTAAAPERVDMIARQRLAMRPALAQVKQSVALPEAAGTLPAVRP